MDIGLILKVVGVGMLVTVSCQILSKAGREEQSMLVSLAGIVTVLLLLLGEIGKLYENIRGMFGF